MRVESRPHCAAALIVYEPPGAVGKEKTPGDTAETGTSAPPPSTTRGLAPAHGDSKTA